MDSEASTSKRQLEENESSIDGNAKRAKLEVEEIAAELIETTSTDDLLPDQETRKILHPNPLPPVISRTGLKPKLPDLPPSLALVTGITPDLAARNGVLGEREVGIIGYAGPQNVRGVRGVIKQR